MRETYIVRNTYNIQCATSYKTALAALKARDRREGDGWEVIDLDGDVWDWDNNGLPVVTRKGE